MKNLSEIASQIEALILNADNVATQYLTVYSVKGDEINLRVGNHSANRQNNGDKKTISFVSSRTMQRKSGYNQMADEHEIDMDTMLSDSYQDIETILDWADVSDNQEAAKKMNEENYL